MARFRQGGAPTPRGRARRAGAAIASRGSGTPGALVGRESSEGETTSTDHLGRADGSSRARRQADLAGAASLGAATPRPPGILDAEAPLLRRVPLRRLGLGGKGRIM